MIKSAIISECGKYRYRLDRRWAEGGKTLCYVMLNPSTADADVDDPTIRKCIGYAKRDGFSAIVVVNVFAWRATDPKLLPKDGLEAMGILNIGHITSAYYDADTVVFAWGSGRVEEHTGLYLKNLCILTSGLSREYTGNGSPMCLGTNKDGSPKHPLYLKKTTPIVPWDS